MGVEAAAGLRRKPRRFGNNLTDDYAAFALYDRTAGNIAMDLAINMQVDLGRQVLGVDVGGEQGAGDVVLLSHGVDPGVDRVTEDGGDPGVAARLADYASARREDRERTLAFSDGLARITSSEGFPLHVLRSLGLLALGHVPGLADPLVAGAMGFRGRVPGLSRGRA